MRLTLFLRRGFREIPDSAHFRPFHPHGSPRPPGLSPTRRPARVLPYDPRKVSLAHHLVVGGHARPLAEVACSSGKSALEQSGGPAPARSGPLDCVPVAFPCQSRGNGRPDKAPCLRVAPWATIDLEFLKVLLEASEDHFSTGDAVGASRSVKWHERVRNIITLVAHTKRKVREAVYTILQ